MTENNNRNKINIVAGVSLIALFLSAIAIFKFFSSDKKIAFVRSSDLVNEYLGMKEAQNSYKEKTDVWQANIDTLELDLQKAISKYNTEAASLSKEDKLQREQFLQKQQQNLMQYSDAIRNKAKEEDEKITHGVLNQVNSFVEEYAKKNGYDLIFGTTLSGSILYGTDALDITEKVLDELNKQYHPGSIGNAVKNESN